MSYDIRQQKTEKEKKKTLFFFERGRRWQFEKILNHFNKTAEKRGGEESRGGFFFFQTPSPNDFQVGSSSSSFLPASHKTGELMDGPLNLPPFPPYLKRRLIFCVTKRKKICTDRIKLLLFLTVINLISLPPPTSPGYLRTQHHQSSLFPHSPKQVRRSRLLQATARLQLILLLRRRRLLLLQPCFCPALAFHRRLLLPSSTHCHTPPPIPLVLLLLPRLPTTPITLSYHHILHWWEETP